MSMNRREIAFALNESRQRLVNEPDSSFVGEGCKQENIYPCHPKTASRRIPLG